jgi:hypothetical protein
MVALAAVIAPRLLEYVREPKSLDEDASVHPQVAANTVSLQQSAENVLATIQSEYVSERLTGFGTITVKATNGDGPIQITPMGTLNYNPSWTAFEVLCGVDSTKIAKTDDVYTITIGGTAEIPTFTMTKS